LQLPTCPLAGDQCWLGCRKLRDEPLALCVADLLEALLEKYADHGAAQFVLPDVLKILPISKLGNPSEIAHRFGGPQQMRIAVDAMTSLIYAG
jgi:EcoEI R protein C-terminal